MPYYKCLCTVIILTNNNVLYCVIYTANADSYAIYYYYLFT